MEYQEEYLDQDIYLTFPNGELVRIYDGDFRSELISQKWEMSWSLED